MMSVCVMCVCVCDEWDFCVYVWETHSFTHSQLSETHSLTHSQLSLSHSPSLTPSISPQDVWQKKFQGQVCFSFFLHRTCGKNSLKRLFVCSTGRVAKEVSGGAEARDGAAPENGEPPAFYGKTAGFCFLKNKKLDSEKKKAQLHGAVWSDLPCPFHLFLYMSVCVLCVCVFMCMCSPPPIPTPAPRRAILMHASWALRCIPRDLSLSLCIWAYGRMCLVAWVDGEVYTQVL